ncbi:NINE protein [Brachyspira hampsonii]|uniref:NINE protein n=1 Tax=Brachyspira hampsonii TaxID=1287055 RepID=UPI003558C734
MILAIFLPVHRFYVGKGGTGILYLITAGGFGIWYIIDIVMIILDKFTDKEGRKLKK